MSRIIMHTQTDNGVKRSALIKHFADDGSWAVPPNYDLYLSLEPEPHWERVIEGTRIPQFGILFVDHEELIYEAQDVWINENQQAQSENGSSTE